jgi:Flp pilus assembly pilin Flp
MKRVWNTLKALHHDEQGADMVEYILVIAAIALPLMAVAIWFSKDIWAYAKDLWTNIKGNPVEP